MEIAMTIPAKAKTGAGKTAAKAARYEGLVPAVIYGGDAEPEMVSIDPRPIWKGLAERGFFAKVMALDVDGKTVNVLPRDIQFDRVPRSSRFKVRLVRYCFKLLAAGSRSG